MSHHPPFKQVEASRPDFDSKDQWKTTKIPAPEWIQGTGGNARADLPGVKEGLWHGKGSTMEIDPKTASVGGLYKMMISGITPRPVGFVSSLDDAGVANLAPFSYFSMVSHDPPTVSVSFTHPSADRLKDTAANILATKEFTVNIISEPFVEAANYTCIDAPADVSEWALSGLTQVQGKIVKPALVGESAFSMECEMSHFHHLHNSAGVLTGTMILGEVKRFHVREDLIDPETLIIDTDKLQPVSRLGGISYGRTTSVYEVPRPVWKDEKDKDAVKKALERGDIKGFAQ